ncbi:VOC family protein [Actinocorallia sp. A-T 12471]|uniref:VOC family protein n=1 Tax=Actinocorallia sp. A-T 12471 TaxID=3089813 RepID=UPI0029D0D0AE|nr:VOC family protein [Actinocorallia sp. A-T 12471]MDX6739446.1 VOC family protein [Actinocorallia sp. A-T 12471]
MPVSEVHHVAVTVSDLERAASFYEKGLGYRRTLSAEVGGPEMTASLRLPDGTTGRVQYLQGPSQIGQLELIEWAGEKLPAHPVDHRRPGVFLLSFQVPADELDALHDRLAELGGTCVSRPNKVLLQNYGFIHAFAAYDPDGNLLEFVALPDRAEILAFRAAAAKEEA